MVQIEKRPVLSQMDPFFRDAIFYFAEFSFYNWGHAAVEYEAPCRRRIILLVRLLWHSGRWHVVPFHRGDR